MENKETNIIKNSNIEKIEKRKPSKWLTRVGCFSPEAMFATMALEFGGSIWVAFRYKLNKVAWLTIGLLVFLGGMQLSEFVLCGMNGNFPWYHIAYASITMLPPLGISLAMALAKKKALWWQIFMYVICGGFMAYWLFSASGVTGDKCAGPGGQGNWVVFKANNDAMWMFGTYYYVFLAIGTFLCIYWGYKSTSKRTSLALYGLAIGYVVFIFPTILVSLLDPATQAAIPSVMCGFAALLAVMLIFLVIRFGGKKRSWQDEEEITANVDNFKNSKEIKEDNKANEEIVKKEAVKEEVINKEKR